MSEIVLSCNGLSKTFRQGDYAVEVLKDVDFEVREGERVAIVGASGSGKSTFLHLLGGLDTPSTGSVTLQGKQFDTLSESERGNLRNRVLGFVYQFHHLLPEFSALDNVAMPLMIRREKRERAHEAAMEILEFTKLADKANLRGSDLTVADRKRVEIARALATNPKMLMLDEAMAGLNQTEVQQAVEMVRQIRDRGISIMIVEHIMEVVLPLSDWILVMDQGQLIMEGTRDQVVNDERVISAYLGVNKGA